MSESDIFILRYYPERATPIELFQYFERFTTLRENLIKDEIKKLVEGENNE